LRFILEGEDVNVVGEAGGVAGLDPGVLLADAVVVAGEGLLEEAARAISVGDEGRGMVLLSYDERSVYKLRLLAPGGWGLVSPDAPPAELSAAVVGAARGLVVLPKELAGRFVEEPAFEKREPIEPLTARELEVLALLAQGLPNKQIARDLGISEHTVKFHVSGIFAKLGAGSRAEAVSLGARRGLILL
jgi:DNA-binding NarL/FixJ family response regulator